MVVAMMQETVQMRPESIIHMNAGSPVEVVEPVHQGYPAQAYMVCTLAQE